MTGFDKVMLGQHNSNKMRSSSGSALFLQTPQELERPIYKVDTATGEKEILAAFRGYFSRFGRPGFSRARGT